MTLRPARATAAFALVLILAAPALAADPPSQIPCSDPRGCPDLVVDAALFAAGVQRTQNFSPASCAVQEGMIQAGARQVLRFTFATPNVGDGDLIVGSPAAHPEWFEWHACHGHYHFKEYADYRVWTVPGFLEWDQLRRSQPDKTANEVLAENPHLVDEFVAGNKMGFCVIDIAPGLPTAGAVAVPPDPFPKYTNCNNAQGITRGWQDVYHFTLDGQWVDVTDVPTGGYVLESEVNAERLYRESDYANNRAFLPVAVL